MVEKGWKSLHVEECLILLISPKQHIPVQFWRNIRNHKLYESVYIKMLKVYSKCSIAETLFVFLYYGKT